MCPKQYALRHNLPLAQATADVMAKSQALQGQLEWYCVDYWSRELELDIALLKREVSHLIRIHPHVIPFLESQQRSARRVVLVTNAHTKSLALKMEQTRLHTWLDASISSHDLGVAKEHPDFWHRLQTD